jgi:hypothetical protein
MQTLKVRITHKYLDTWKDQDIWKEMGEYEITKFEKWIKETEDILEPNLHYYWVTVYPELGVSVQDVRNALIDCFTHTSCSHDYDCCGCRTFYVTYAEHLASDGVSEEWKVTVDSWRNF